MKARRLLSALMLLQGHPRLTTRDLAERLQVSERTAHRDMESLCQAGIPLIAHRGPHGGWEIARDWRTRVPGLDEHELRALLMAQPAALTATPGLQSAAESGWQKLIAAMPATMQLQAASMLARLHIDPGGWWHPLEETPALPAVQEAVARDLQLTFLYTRPGAEPTLRTVDPLGIVWKQTIWYLVARTPNGMRTYRISRIQDATVLPTPFLRPAFDLAQYWRASQAEMKQQRGQHLATIAAAPEATASLSRWLHVEPQPTRPHGIPRNWQAFTIEFDSPGQAKFICLGLGSQVRVLHPPELRRAVLADAKKITARKKKT